MLFKKELAEKIMTGEKTQTRRPIKDGEKLRVKESPFGGVDPVAVMQGNGRTKMRVGGDYAVQYGRGKPCRWFNPETKILMPWDDYQYSIEHGEVHAKWVFNQNGYKPMRIRVTDIRRVDVREINHADALAEGFRSTREFWEVWCKFYDKPALKEMDNFSCPEDWIAWIDDTREHVREMYFAWAYTFELV